MTTESDSAASSNSSHKVRANTKFITLDGETKALAVWARESKTPKATIIKRLQRGWGPLEAIFCPVEDPEFCLARNIICAVSRKNAADKLTERDFHMFNIWASIMNRCGETHNIYRQAIAKGPSGEYFKNGGKLEDWMRKLGAI